MEFQTISTIETTSRVTAVPVFVLKNSPSKRYYLQRREKHFEICTINYKASLDRPDKHFSIHRCVLDYPVSKWPTQSPNIDQEKVLKTMPSDAFVDVIMDGKWDPSMYTTKPNTRPLKMEFYERVPGHSFLAVLMSNGALYLYKRRKLDWFICLDIGSLHVAKLAEDTRITSYEKLEQSLGNMEIVTFEWLDNGTKPDQLTLFWVTKNGGVYTGTIDATEGELKVQIQIQDDKLEETQNIQMISKDHFVRVTNDKQISLFKVELDAKKSSSFKLIKVSDLWTESDGIIVNCIGAKPVDDNTVRIFLIKERHLLIFTLDAKYNLKETIAEQLPGPFATGLQLIDATQLVVTLVNGKILHGSLIKGKITFVDMQNEFDPNFTCTGLVRARNSAFWMLSFTAGKPYDYTVLTTPEKMVLSTFSQISPLQMVLNDPERKISNHLEYFESIRYKKNSVSVEYQWVQDKINSEAETGSLEQIVYLLKVQLFLLEASTKLDSKPTETSVEKTRFLRDIILSIRFHESLSKLVEVLPKLTTFQLSVLSSLRMFLSNLSSTKDHYGQSLLMQRLKGTFKSTLDATKQHARKVQPEICEMCDQEILFGKSHCIQMHYFKRCCYTNLQVPLMSTANCRICGMQSLEVSVINEVLKCLICPPICSTCDMEIE